MNVNCELKVKFKEAECPPPPYPAFFEIEVGHLSKYLATHIPPRV